MSFIEDRDDLLENAFAFADAIHDGEQHRDEAVRLLSAGRVYFPFRYRNHLAFAPAKFIGYKENDLPTYVGNVYNRNGGGARRAVSRVLGFDADDNKHLESALYRYCNRLGVTLQSHRHHFWGTKSLVRFSRSDKSAIDDIDAGYLGNDDPEYRRRMAGSYVRDDAVRRAVLVRANGICEYGNCASFPKRDGSTYLESHHVISLSKQGADNMNNVIALCANHHREAHFGERWELMQDEFIDIITKKNG